MCVCVCGRAFGDIGGERAALATNVSRAGSLGAALTNACDTTLDLVSAARWLPTEGYAVKQHRPRLAVLGRAVRASCSTCLSVIPQFPW